MALASAIHQLIEAPIPARRAPQENAGKAALVHEQREVTRYVAHFDLSQSLIEANQMKRPRRLADVFISVVLHVVLIGTPVFLSLWFTNTLDLKAYTKTMLVGPPPPPSPPPAPSLARAAVAPRHVFFAQGKLVAPTYIPKEVAVLKEAQASDDANLFGVEGGVPGGVPGGQMGGVLGGILGGVATSKVTPPSPPKSKAPYRVGGRIQPPRATYMPAPDYPPLAKATRIEGVVIISAILDEDGDVVQMKIVSGPPLLYQAALNAVGRWKYQPTALNGEPISVEMNIIVNFHLSGPPL